jgi:copper chaperone CopZ
MNAQEIKQNMTKGEWVVDGQDIINQEKCMACDVFGLSDVQIEANANAITTAVNNTYGKGIDPTKVEQMFEELQSIVINNCATAKDVDRIERLLQQAKI